VQSDRFEIKTTVKIDCCNDISRITVSPSSKRKGLVQGTYCSVGTMPDTPPVVIFSFCSRVADPLTASAPFIPIPVVMSVDIGYEREVGEMKAFA
jgi:hypothetical protein